MTNDFNIQKVSSQVKTDVAKAISGGKVSTAADRLEEYDALSKILSGTSNADEQKYIKKYMEEYTNKYELQDYRERATDFGRNVVDRIKNLLTQDNKLDAEEAKHLAMELTNSYEEGRKQDAHYMFKEVKKAGFKEMAIKALDKAINNEFIKAQKQRDASKADTNTPNKGGVTPKNSK